MPAAFGFFLGALFILGLIKYPIFISILKLAKGSNHHGNEPPCWFRQLHCITFEGLAVGVLLVESQLPEASIAGAVTLARIEFRIFQKELPSMPLRRMGMSRWKSLWATHW
jgi:hypothetical protein